MAETKIIDLSGILETGVKGFLWGVSPWVETWKMFDHKEFADLLLIKGTGMIEDEVKKFLHPSGELACWYRIITTDHPPSTHIDSTLHCNPNGYTADKIPLEHCYGDGVVLDLTHKKGGEFITTEDLANACKRIEYTIKPNDIVLLRTGLGDDDKTFEDHEEAYKQGFVQPGLSRESTLWLLDQGVKVIATDSFIGPDRGQDRLDLMVKDAREKGWKMFPVHMLVREREFFLVEYGRNFNKIPKPFGFKVCAFPLKIKTGGSPIRLVAIVEL